MKKKITILTLCVLVCIALFTLSKNNDIEIIEQSETRSIHKKNLENSPFKDVLKLSKPERRAAGLTPNKYYEQEWELTMNPVLGRPTSEGLKQIKADQQLKRQAFLASGRVPGDGLDNSWLERGPNNVGGRTRAIMFDPNDATNETLFAGGVSGGLWKNTNISNVNSSWIRVDIAENLAVTCITYDPNNSNIFYLGTGESYVSGDVNGDGVWKSEDAGVSWTKVLGGISGPTTVETIINTVTINSPSGIAGEYVSNPTTLFGAEITSVISGDLILANGTVPFTGSNGVESIIALEGCGPSTVDMTGKIALVRRGACSFTEKVKAAQVAGAIGVIVMDNVDGALVNMSGDDGSIVIPAVFVSKVDGDILEAAVSTEVVTGSLNPQIGTLNATLVPGIQFVNDIKVRDNNGVSEVYVAAGDSFYSAANTGTILSGAEFGLYKSVDNGVSWNELSLPLTTDGNKHCPNDIEIGADNKLWVSTINSTIFGDGGGEVFSSIDGNTFTMSHTVAEASRTQIAVSETDPGVVYILAEGNDTDPVIMEKTIDGFVSTTSMSLPNDVDTDIDANDFARGQAFYDLMLEVDPNNDQIVYAGGIDLFKSFDAGVSWVQFTHWYGWFGYQEVHADQHAMTFANGSSTIMAFGNDGGVYYSANGSALTESRNKDFNTSQFYTVGVAPTTAFTGDYFAGGLQDNGTHLFEDANTTQADASREAYGGDGAYTFFDQDGTDQYFIRNYVYNSGVYLYDLSTDTDVVINDESDRNGAFINPQALDSNLDILYSNYSSDGNSIIRRYSGIKSQGTLEAVSLTDPEMDSTPTAFTVSPYTTTTSTLLVGTVLGDIFLVENADGATPVFTELDLSNVIVGSVSDLEFGRSEDEIFLTVHNYGVQSIWYTDDGGAVWQEKEGDLPDMPVKAILQNPLNTNEVIIGTDLGVWSTTNFSEASPNWSQAFNGMTNVKVTDLDLRDDNMVFAATYGRGIFSGEFKLDSNGDEDGDGILNGVDNCVYTANADQTDADGDGVGDVCQDSDNDGILDSEDNCVNTANADQVDTDGDGVGDACQDDDGDGVFADVDNCLDIANPGQEDTNGNGIGDVCDTSHLSSDNISLEIISERCEDQDNGTVIVNVNETYVTYTATVVGNGVSLSEQITTNTFAFEDLAVGSYTVCVSINDTTYQQCFEISIEEADVIDLQIVNNNNDSGITYVEVSRGTAPYTVVFNGEVVQITSIPNFELELIGSGELEIKTAKACEGTYKTSIENTFNIIASPNPVINNLKITLPNSVTQSEVGVHVFDVNGRLVIDKNYARGGVNFIEVPFSNLNKGIYFIKLDVETSEVFKIIKK
ncbi:thrombospondin type 3 repeat-containing protein [Psychroserpens sp. NJDZ02]|uniref:thrombospondin type 3 repeat-containing protein n=1 Tax=Psychroserpens sp. NJDZ02 TaxID=2570561 RepID=UPI0010A7E56E|nr:thrombospondin type 3 repeat-containing protein [Psychroserpens sp. NJDZ02]QCE40806.1 T9SS type A sorting domain-containing protein [Psychroserpens sp. NJDZ02]